MTFRHVVCFRWSEDTSDEDVARFTDMLAGLPGLIPELRRYHFGRDAGAAEGNFDYAVAAEFDDRDGWVAYQEHPEHRRCIEYVRPLIRDRVAVQFDV